MKTGLLYILKFVKHMFKERALQGSGLAAHFKLIIGRDKILPLEVLHPRLVYMTGGRG